MSEKNTDSPLMITILGATATGKTRIAAQVAAACNGEIISADSRQVYRKMDLGTGKDYGDYIVNGTKIPYHLIDIANPGDEYNVFNFLNDFKTAFGSIISRGKVPVMCGGSGMYLEAVLKNYHLTPVHENPELRQQMANKSLAELTVILKSFKTPHNTTDTTSVERAIRAIEICSFKDNHPENQAQLPAIKHKIYGISIPRQLVRERITKRLEMRLKSGMLIEVEQLLNSGLQPEQLRFYGLEYRYLTDYVTGRLIYEEMFRQLNTSIHQFAKRQMTWFRRMENRGIAIKWLDGQLSAANLSEIIINDVSFKTAIDNIC